MASDRVVVVSHSNINSPLKVFEYCDGEGWDRAHDWIESHGWEDDNRINISSARVH